MLIQQTHFPQISPDWVKISLISLGIIATGYIIYQSIKLAKIKVELKPEYEKKDE
jgi:hypothetical protein